MDPRCSTTFHMAYKTASGKTKMRDYVKVRKFYAFEKKLKLWKKILKIKNGYQHKAKFTLNFELLSNKIWYLSGYLYLKTGSYLLNTNQPHDFQRETGQKCDLVWLSITKPTHSQHLFKGNFHCQPFNVNQRAKLTRSS